MKEHELSDFAAMLNRLCSAFGRQPDETLLDVYWDALRGFDLEDVRSAMRRAESDAVHFPRPAELRRLLGTVSPEQRALKAWTAVCGAIASVGSYRSVDFDDALTNATVRLTGGWGRLCRMPDRDLEFARADFVRVYAMLTNAPTAADQCRHLPGVAEMENGANGLPVPEPVAIAVGLPPSPHRLTSGGSPVTLAPKRLGGQHV